MSTQKLDFSVRDMVFKDSEVPEACIFYRLEIDFRTELRAWASYESGFVSLNILDFRSYSRTLL